MVQFLPPVQGFGDKLREALVGATGNVAQAIAQRRAKTQLQKLFEPEQQQQPTQPGQEGQPPAQGQMSPQGQPMQPGITPFQRLISEPGGPSPMKVFALSDLVGKVYGPAGSKFVMDMAANQANLVGKEGIKIREQERAKANEIEKEERGKVHQIEKEDRERANKYLEGAVKSREELLGQKTSLDLAEQAVNAGTSSGLFNGDFWATQLGLPELRSAEGAVLDASAKTHLLTSMGNLSGGRPNMFLEKQISQAFALPGGRKEGNLAKLQVLKTLANMKGTILEEGDKIAQKYQTEGKPIPGNIEQLALKEAMPKIEKIQKISSYKIQDLLEPARGSPELDRIEKVAKGTPLTEKKAEVIFRKANPDADIAKATDEEIQRAVKLARGLGYDDSIFDLIAEGQ